MTSFKDKVAIVTGGASGIGRGLCAELGRRDAAVIVADLDGQGAEQVASRIIATGGRASPGCVDITEIGQVQRLIDATLAEHGRLDFMFNNAGIGIWGDVRDMTPEDWRRVLDVNLWGVIHGSITAYAVMVKQGFGHIVNTASLAGVVSVPTIIPYATAKHAVVGFSTSLRAEAADLGVKVSVVCPGPVRTQFYDSLHVAGPHRSGPRVPADALDAGQAARIILRGVARNTRIIVFPGRARLTWMVYRILPSLSARTCRKSVRKLRASRSEST
jgi:NAD(P)-dependent dehydrogenase (short-subunit alcohol dehydrogenase family)